MTLEQLQRRTLRVLKRVVRQFNRMPHEGGLNDIEFIEQVLDPLRNDIQSDRDVLKMIAERESNA